MSFQTAQSYLLGRQQAATLDFTWKRRASQGAPITYLNATNLSPRRASAAPSSVSATSFPMVSPPEAPSRGEHPGAWPAGSRPRPPGRPLLPPAPPGRCAARAPRLRSGSPRPAAPVQGHLHARGSRKHLRGIPFFLPGFTYRGSPSPGLRHGVLVTALAGGNAPVDGAPEAVRRPGRRDSTAAAPTDCPRNSGGVGARGAAVHSLELGVSGRQDAR